VLISFIGFMGSGKSTLTRRISRMALLPVLDLDQLISERTGRSVADIFVAEGEAGFRRLEAETLRDLEVDETTLLACGGGLVETPECRRLLRDRGVVIWLDAPWSDLWDQLLLDDIDRPLLREMDRTGFAERYRQRRPIYAATADFRLRVGRSGVENLARQAMACSLFWSRNTESAS